MPSSIRILNPDSDTDPLTWLNPDPIRIRIPNTDSNVGHYAIKNAGLNYIRNLRKTEESLPPLPPPPRPPPRGPPGPPSIIPPTREKYKFKYSKHRQKSIIVSSACSLRRVAKMKLAFLMCRLCAQPIRSSVGEPIKFGPILAFSI